MHYIGIKQLLRVVFINLSSIWSKGDGLRLAFVEVLEGVLLELRGSWHQLLLLLDELSGVYARQTTEQNTNKYK